MKVRLQKYLADQGVGSRRASEKFILDGLIKVNGEIATIGMSVDPEVDKIEVDPKLDARQQSLVYYMLNKPTGYISTVGGQDGLKVTDLFAGIPERVFPVGRLDKMTSGLIFVTNDGRFAYFLTHPKFEKEKEYVVKVKETLTEDIMIQLREPFFIRGRKTRSPEITKMASHMFQIILKEGRNRQIRRMCERAQLHIQKLKRIRIANIMLGNLEPGEYRKLTQAEVTSLFNQFSSSGNKLNS